MSSQWGDRRAWAERFEATTTIRPVSLRFIRRHGEPYLLIRNRMPALLSIGLMIDLNACGKHLAAVRVHLRGIDPGPNRIAVKNLGLPDVRGLIPRGCRAVDMEVSQVSDPSNKAVVTIPLDEFLSSVMGAG